MAGSTVQYNQQLAKANIAESDDALARFRAITQPMPWDKLPKEQQKSYELFQYFRDMGPGRTLAAVARDWGRGDRYIKRLASERRWWDRAMAWDEHLRKERDQAILDSERTMAVRQAKLGMKMQDLALERVEEIAQSPELKATLTVGDVVRLADTGVKIERLARGETTGDERTLNFVIPGGLPKWAPQATPKVIEGDGGADAAGN